MGSCYNQWTQDIRFPKVIFNEGSDYDSATGVFTCRIHGMYWFSAAIANVQTSPGYIECFINVNGGGKIWIQSTNSGTGSAAFHLKIGDRVQIGHCVHQDKIHSSPLTYFSGVLIRPDAQMISINKIYSLNN